LSGNLTNYFTPLTGSAKEEVIRFIRERNVEVTFKVYDLHSKSSFVKVDGADLAIFKKYAYDYETTNVLCSFQFDNEPHFFRSKLTTSSNYYLVKFPEKIYKIQRRENFRFIVPENLKHGFRITQHPEAICTLKDISMGGCKVLIKTPTEISIPMEADLQVIIELLDFGAVKLDCTVVFSKHFPETGSQLLGLKFGQIDSEMLSILHTTLIQVDRLARGKANE
jgi:hypothetical protein